MQSNNIITVDNSTYKRQVFNLFEQGDFKYNKGQNFDVKEEGVNLILKGMKILLTWIDSIFKFF